MAEAILRKKIKERKIKWWDVQSCGINAEVNSTISKNSALALKEMGIDCGGFKPRQLRQKYMDASFLVITMTTSQKQLLEGCGNILCVKDICGYDIPDPYGGDLNVYRVTCNAIDKACDKIIENYILKN
jgi:protein-tyrosine-phosphatase